MQERMRSANHPFKLRIGISTGIATTGIIGAKRQSFTAFGDTVNLASRIEALCKPGRVTVDEATVHECSDNFEFRPVTGLTPFADLANAGVTESLNASMMEVEENPNSIGSRIELAQLLVKVEDLEEAMIQFKAAMDLDPDNAEIKIAYADLAFQIEQNRNVSVRGRSSTVHLYEIVGPEDLVLPVECMDGSVGFSRLIGATAFLIADRMELADQDKHEILEAGYLGQIGKTIVPENVLNRNGGLTEDELTLIHMHPREGVRKLRNVGYDNERMLELIECSHENFDGSGYPAGIKGDNIPLGARILAVAEAYVSLTSKRPYRNPWDGRAAMTELSKYVQTGKFDPAVVEALSQIVAEL
jgi:adenylate cyclase